MSFDRPPPVRTKLRTRPGVTPPVRSSRSPRAGSSNLVRDVAADPNVVDLWPDSVPITTAEIDIVELYLGRLIDNVYKYE